MSIRVCIDIGGTFTDLAVVNSQDGMLNIFKSSTTPDDYTRGVVDGIAQAADFYGISLGQFLDEGSSYKGGALNYGTTIGTNAVIQKKLAKVGLICTQGHRDILTLRESGKKDPFYWDLDYPDPYVPRRLTLPVRERIDAQGMIITPLDESDVKKTIERFKSDQVEVIAVALLWSTVNPTHELKIGRIIEKELPGQPYVLSHIINPIPREYRRSIATVINASLLPVVGPYIQGFDEKLKDLGYKGELSLISCFGGILSVKDISKRPIYSYDSGPTGAPVAGRFYCRREFNTNNIITCDMGGTSFDVSRVSDGIIGITSEARIGLDYLGVRKVDTRSIGAGGGSIAWVDSGGMLHVGPESAGSHPGPACYGHGGNQPTTTDANVVLGYLNPGHILGCKMSLEYDAAMVAILRNVAEPLDLTAEEAAFAIWSTVCANMTDAIREITSWEGIDPCEYVFVSGGGAGGCHILPMISELGVTQLIIPKTAGILSAAGGLAADMVAEFQRTYECTSRNYNAKNLNNVLVELTEEADCFLSKNKIAADRRKFEFTVDARYHSQPWELTINLPIRQITGDDDMNAVVDEFHCSHDRIRGSREEGNLVEFSTWRVNAVGKTYELESAVSRVLDIDFIEKLPVGFRLAYFKDLGGMVETPIFDGIGLTPGCKVDGPAIIEEPSTTIVIFPGHRATVSVMGNYVVECSESFVTMDSLPSDLRERGV